LPLVSDSAIRGKRVELLVMLMYAVFEGFVLTTEKAELLTGSGLPPKYTHASRAYDPVIASALPE